MLGFQLKYKGNSFIGTDFVGHGNGTVIELTKPGPEGRVESVIVAPAIACEITRVHIKEEEEGIESRIKRGDEIPNETEPGQSPEKEDASGGSTGHTD